MNATGARTPGRWRTPATAPTASSTSATPPGRTRRSEDHGRGWGARQASATGYGRLPRRERVGGAGRGSVRHDERQGRRTDRYVRATPTNGPTARSSAPRPASVARCCVAQRSDSTVSSSRAPETSALNPRRFSKQARSTRRRRGANAPSRPSCAPRATPRPRRRHPPSTHTRRRPSTLWSGEPSTSSRVRRTSRRASLIIDRKHRSTPPPRCPVASPRRRRRRDGPRGTLERLLAIGQTAAAHSCAQSRSFATRRRASPVARARGVRDKTGDRAAAAATVRAGAGRARGRTSPAEPRRCRTLLGVAGLLRADVAVLPLPGRVPVAARFRTEGRPARRRAGSALESSKLGQPRAGGGEEGQTDKTEYALAGCGLFLVADALAERHRTLREV